MTQSTEPLEYLYAQLAADNALLRAVNADLLYALDQLELWSSHAIGIGGGQDIPLQMMNSQIGKAIAQARAAIAKATS